MLSSVTPLNLPLTSVASKQSSVPKFTVWIECIGYQDALLDTGAAVNVLASSLVPAHALLHPTSLGLFTVNGTAIHTLDILTLQVRTVESTSPVEFVVLENSVCPVVFGYEWCRKSNFLNKEFPHSRDNRFATSKMDHSKFLSRHKLHLGAARVIFNVWNGTTALLRDSTTSRKCFELYFALTQQVSHP